MRNVTSVSLPPDLVKAVGRFGRQKGVSVSEIARDALRDYLYWQELEEARRHFTAHVQKRGIASELDLVRTLDK